MTWRLALSILVCLALSLPEVEAQTVLPRFLDAPVGEAHQALPPLRFAESIKLTPQAQLRAATEAATEELSAMEAHNSKGLLPTQNGFARRLTAPVTFDLAQDAESGSTLKTSTGSTVWGTRVHVAGAHRLRLHLDKVDLPAGSRMWVWGRDGEPRAFGLELRSPEGDLWTPSVAGGELFFEVELPSGATRAAVRVTEVLELFAVTASKAEVGCLLDATCFDEADLQQIEGYRRAVAQLQFVSGGVGAICTGALLNDTDDSSLIPYLLTANHCFSTASAASSLEASWDYRTATCAGALPGALPRSQGATLLATGTLSDFTLVRLNAIPTGRAFLGWTATPPPAGSRLFRISHPAPDGVIFPQAFSTTVHTNAGPTCDGWPRSSHLYSVPELGVTFGGSSGSPVVLPGGFVVGQLRGACGQGEGCGVPHLVVDGAFSATFPAIVQFLAPGGSDDPAPPAGNWLTTPELPGFRFKARISNTRIATPVSDCVPETLCLAGAVADRTEIFVRIIGPRPNGFLWPQVVRFTVARVEVWIQEGTNGPINYYLLPGVSQDSDVLDGLVDREGFRP